MDWRSRIVADADVLVGKPVIKGMRISVELVMGSASTRWERRLTTIVNVAMKSSGSLPVGLLTSPAVNRSGCPNVPETDASQA